jgi:hypothetical protein
LGWFMAAPSSWVEGSLRSLRAARRRRATTQNDVRFGPRTTIAIATEPRTRDRDRTGAESAEFRPVSARSGMIPE